MADTTIINGTVVLPGGVVQAADISIVGGRIAGIHEPGAAPDADEVIDASGRHVLPGAIDAHIHLGGYQPLEVDTEPGTGLAALGGVTTLVNYFKATGSYLDLVPQYIETYERGSYIDAAFHLQLLTQPHLDELVTVTKRFGITSYKINLAWKGREKAVFDSDRPVDNGWIWSAMEAMRAIDPERMVLNVHCENAELKNEARRRAGELLTADLATYETLAPDISETDSVLSMMMLAKETGVRTYLVHLSAALTCDALRLEWARNDRLYTETCPHYLMHTVDSPAGLLATVSPPVRTTADQDALWDSIADGTLDVIGSDANPIMRAAKLGDGDLATNKPGFDGVGMIVPTTLSEGYHRRGIPLGRLSQVMSENPAKIFGLYPKKGALLPGSDADLVLVDLDREHTVGPEATAAHSDFSIYAGMTLRGWPVVTMSRGEVIARDGALVAKPGRGKYLPREV
jgi:dihydropyrimidinase